MFGNTHTSSKNRILGGLVYTTITSRAMTYPDRINVVIARKTGIFAGNFAEPRIQIGI